MPSSHPIRIVSLVSLAVALSTSFASAEFAGMDRNNDLLCGPSDMGIADATAGEDFSIDVFFADLPPLQSWGCTFCVQDRNTVTSSSWTYDTPEGWDNVPVHNSIDDFVDVSGALVAAYPDIECWLVQATDWTNTNYMLFPARLGYFVFEAATDGCIGFVIDGAYSGWFYSGAGGPVFGLFDGDGETCPPFDCGGATGTKSANWGEVKRLFR